MKGTIVNVDTLNQHSGIISGADGQRYKFANQDWKGNVPANQGMEIDFVANGEFAVDIYPIVNQVVNYNQNNQNLLGQNQNPPKQRVIFILLGIFLGFFGIHNFYAGRTGKGVAQLLITVLSLSFLSGISWIWAIIEVVTITNDGKGNKME